MCSSLNWVRANETVCTSTHKPDIRHRLLFHWRARTINRFFCILLRSIDESWPPLQMDHKLSITLQLYWFHSTYINITYTHKLHSHKGSQTLPWWNWHLAFICSHSFNFNPKKTFSNVPFQLVRTACITIGNIGRKEWWGGVFAWWMRTAALVDREKPELTVPCIISPWRGSLFVSEEETMS